MEIGDVSDSFWCGDADGYIEVVGVLAAAGAVELEVPEALPDLDLCSLRARVGSEASNQAGAQAKRLGVKDEEHSKV